MKNIIMAAISFSFIFVGASQALAQSESAQSAKKDLQLIEKFQGSELSKRLIKRHCKSLPEISDLCAGSEMTPAAESTVEQAVKEDLQQKSVQSTSVSNNAVVSGASTSVNVSQGSGNSQSSSVIVTGSSDCVKQAMANINKFNSGFAARLNKNINRN